jgi:signal transduction histidine kinase
MVSEQEGLPAEATEDLAHIQEAGVHLIRLIDEVLELARIQAGYIDLQLDQVEVADLVAQVVQTTRPLVAQSNRLEVPVADDLGPMATERRKLEHSLVNLLGNAAKFTSGGEVGLSVTRREGAVYFVVSDTGEGSAADALGALFTPFTQADSSHTRETDGAGLGLTLTREFALALGGDVTVESVVGKGSTFTLRLPRVGPNRATAPILSRR